MDLGPIQSLMFTNPTRIAQDVAAEGADLKGLKLPTEELSKLGSLGADRPLSVGQGGDSFANVLGKMVSEVNAKQAAAGESVGQLLSGQNVPLHQTMLAIEEASVSFQLMVEVRNKLLESYQELMRMQI
jgi:flagellar hook-basal body complex protein FliE